MLWLIGYPFRSHNRKEIFALIRPNAKIKVMKTRAASRKVNLLCSIKFTFYDPIQLHN
jgi:hypothetical protein